MPNRLYLDHAATTPVRPEAAAAMADGLTRWANPSSPHAEGRAARAALEEARAAVADALGWRGTVIFTSGATEAIALAVARTDLPSVAMSGVEHDAVRRAAPRAAVLPVDGDGRVVAVDGPALVAVQQVNGETGVIQPDVGAAVRAAGGLWLADCAQGAGKLPLPDADLCVVSGHKLGGPPGVGALLVRDPAMLRPAGGQESGYRGGTENLPAILGLAAALRCGSGWLDRAAALRARLEAGIVAAGGTVIAARAPRLATVGAYRMPGVSAAAQLMRFDLAGIAVSAGSACATASLKPSPTLAAMGVAHADEVIRIGIGWTTTAADIDRVLDAWTGLAAGRRAA